jgi:hypothetical protein
MSGKIAGDRNEDVSPWVSIAPSGELHEADRVAGLVGDSSGYSFIGLSRQTRSDGR